MELFLPAILYSDVRFSYSVPCVCYRRRWEHVKAGTCLPTAYWMSNMSTLPYRSWRHMCQQVNVILHRTHLYTCSIIQRKWQQRTNFLKLQKLICIRNRVNSVFWNLMYANRYNHLLSPLFIHCWLVHQHNVYFAWNLELDMKMLFPK